MKYKEFIAELHDIGKLVDKQTLKQEGIEISGHTFHQLDFSQIGISQPSSPSWYAQFTEEIGSLASTKISQDHLPNVILTSIADELASTISRTYGGSRAFRERKKRGDFVSEGIHVLWNPEFYEKEKDKGRKWAAFSTLRQLKEMFKFIDDCKNQKEFFVKFKDNLTLTSEEKSTPFNIVSLFTHLQLTGKIYRISRNHSQTVKENGRLYLKYLNKRIQTVNEAAGGRIEKPKQKGKWIYRLIFCNITFPQSLCRLQDLNIFGKRADLIKAFSEDENSRDYVLFFTDDFMCLFIPKEDEIKIRELLKQFLESGFIIDYKEMEAELNLLTSSMERAYKEFHSSSTTRHLRIYEKRESVKPPSEIPPHLCDSCQMKHGKERLKDDIHEYLCDTCYGIREMGDSASEYAEWEGKAAWMKITLDQERLLEVLRRLFGEYVDSYTLMQSVGSNDKAELKKLFKPLAVQMDFVKDYNLLLKAFNSRIYEVKNDEGNPFFTKETFRYPIDSYYEFGIFKVRSGDAILRVLDLFNNLLDEYFPECLEDSPIKLSLSVATVKYPSQEHWQFLSTPEEAINIQSPGSTNLSLNITRYKLLREKIKKEDIKLSHFLHRLANIEIETESSLFVILEIFNNRKKFSTLLELTQNGLLVQQILDFYKLTREVTIL